ncbi:hypothetical protein K493DRAFT_338072 [Basidiobolus meristosporus CBS 931.73]|uniref:Uncharacterized protein n=1 Tax=Basidiobolus meristosporus CBS 931.73 TaxID=1314790 RepID=A0A1Y1Y7A2_9FUNG|nr:hypothetical protein K493DRAFT_338072 [Basidiobolus meristosporus CBS 931.73]|eukprot:ORX93892.1 hypothetical protein K493DRAFT_338072 [Basidiobolus meristosporus CBS 931.73]
MLNQQILNQVSRMSREELELTLLKASSRHDDVYNQIVFTSQSLDRAYPSTKCFDQVVYWYEQLDSNSITLRQRYYLLSAITESLTEHMIRFNLNDPSRYFQVWSSKGIYQMKRSVLPKKVGERWKAFLIDHHKEANPDINFSKSDWKRMKAGFANWEATLRTEGLTLGCSYEIKLLVERAIHDHHSYYFSKDLMKDSGSETMSRCSEESDGQM